MITWSNLSFVFFCFVFVAASAVSSVFILPLLFMSFVFSGFVVIFSGLSYTTFRLASSKYNHTVLLLNKLLRKLADNIPPSVGFLEVTEQNELSKGYSLSSFGFSLPELNLKGKAGKVRGIIQRPFRINSAFANPPPTAVEDQDFVVEHVGQVNPNAKVISDEDVEPFPSTSGKPGLTEVTMVDVSIGDDAEQQQSLVNDQAIKDSEVET